MTRAGNKQLSSSNGILHPTATAASKGRRKQRKQREEGRETRDWKRDGWPEALDKKRETSTIKISGSKDESRGKRKERREQREERRDQRND